MSGAARPTRRRVIAQAAAALTAGCARTRASDRLRVAFTPPGFISMFRALSKAFETENPGVGVELMPSNGYTEIAHRDFRLALIEDEPDVSFISPTSVAAYAERGMAQPLDARIAASNAPLSFHPQIGRHKGVTHALPFAISAPVCYFNADLLARAGRTFDDVADADWAGIADVAAAVSGLGEPYSGIYFDYNSVDALSWQMLIYGRGGEMMSPDETQIRFDDDDGLWAARMLRRFGRSGQPDLSSAQARVSFMNGQIGAFVNTSSNIERFGAANFELKYAPAPLAPDKGRFPTAGTVAALVTRKSERHDLAWRFIEFAAGPAGQAIMARESGYLTFNRSVLADPSGLQPRLASDPMYARLYRQVDRAMPRFRFPGPRADQIAQALIDSMRRLIVGDRSPEAGLADMAASARRILTVSASTRRRH